jgi:cysteine-rich repeat protein
MYWLVIVLLLGICTPAFGQRVTYTIPPEKGADAIACKDMYTARTGHIITNAGLVDMSVSQFCKREKEIAASKDIRMTINNAVDAMGVGWGKCGNGEQNSDEMCDDGNTISGDGCNAKCTSTEVCGNGFVDPTEACDDRNTVSCDGCIANCSRADKLCGDGIMECGEACDDGNQIRGDGCEPDCTVSR